LPRGVRHRAGRGGGRGGGIVGYPLDQLHEEVAYIAYHFHWPLDHILALEHADRRRWVEEISKINQRLNGEETGAPSVDWEALRARFGLAE
jgi:hypothetical protein